MGSSADAGSRAGYGSLMDAVLGLAAMVAFYAMMIVGIAWLGRRARRHGVGSSVLGVFDEISHPAAHEPHIEIHAHAERKHPGPAPGDPPTS